MKRDMLRGTVSFRDKRSRTTPPQVARGPLTDLDAPDNRHHREKGPAAPGTTTSPWLGPRHSLKRISPQTIFRTSVAGFLR